MDPELDPNAPVDPNLDPEALPGGQDPEGGDPDDATPQPYLRDLTEDDVYDRLSRVQDFPNNLQALESRFSGNVNQLAERLAGIEKGFPTQAALDIEKITKGLQDYDPKLAEVLGPLLQDAIKTSPLDENTLRPHLDPMQKQLREEFGEQLVMSAYSPDDLAEIIPPVKDGRFVPEGQRHKDFVDWYSQQGYQTQQSLLAFGAPYISALRKFEKWEADRNKERAEKAGSATQRLAQGQVPSGQRRTPPRPRQMTDEEAFSAGFKEAYEEVKR